MKVLLAVSGGRDSVAMAHLLLGDGSRAGLRAALPASVDGFAIAHCNFNLRPGDCDRDQRFVEQLANNYGVPFFTTSFNTQAFAAANGYSIEEAARQLRYRFFADICHQHGYACVATAHHRDDSIETFFLNLFRGTGIAGLHGIRPISEMMVDGQRLTVVRPMLTFSRADIDRYVEENHLQYVEDYTNHELDARRNRIRLQLMPLLRELYPSIDETMQSNIDRLFDTELIYRAHIDLLRSRLIHPYIPILPTLPPNLQTLEIPIEELREFGVRSSEFGDITAAPGQLRTQNSELRTILYELLRLYDFNAEVAPSLLRRLDGPSGALFHSPTHTAELHRGKIIIFEKVENSEFGVQNSELQLPHPDNSELRSPLSELSILINGDNFRQPFTVRPWRDGDRFRPFGMKGTRLVSDFLKDKGLPLLERQYVRLLVDADGQPVWLIGLRADERTRITADTVNILKISCSRTANLSH